MLQYSKLRQDKISIKNYSFLFIKKIPADPKLRKTVVPIAVVVDLSGF